MSTGNILSTGKSNVHTDIQPNDIKNLADYRNLFVGYFVKAEYEFAATWFIADCQQENEWKEWEQSSVSWIELDMEKKGIITIQESENDSFLINLTARTIAMAYAKAPAEE